MFFVSPSIHRSIATLCFGYVDASTGLDQKCYDPITKKLIPCPTTVTLTNYQWVGYVVGGITVLNGLFNMFILYSHPGFRTSGVGMDAQGKGAPADRGVGSLQVSSGGQLACCTVLSRVPPGLLHSCAGLFSPIASPHRISSLILPPRHILPVSQTTTTLPQPTHRRGVLDIWAILDRWIPTQVSSRQSRLAVGLPTVYVVKWGSDSGERVAQLCS